MDEQRQDDQLEPIYNSSVLILDVALKTYWAWLTIKTGGKRGSGRSMLAARHNDDKLSKKKTIIDSEPSFQNLFARSCFKHLHIWYISCDIYRSGLTLSLQPVMPHKSFQQLLLSSSISLNMFVRWVYTFFISTYLLVTVTFFFVSLVTKCYCFSNIFLPCPFYTSYHTHNIFFHRHLINAATTCSGHHIKLI